MPDILGRPVEEAVLSLPPGAKTPQVLETSAPRKNGEGRQGGVLRVIRVRGDQWIAARFFDRVQEKAQGKEEP